MSLSPNLQQLLSPEALLAAAAEWERRYRDTTPVVYDEATFRPMVDAFYAAIGLAPPEHLAFYLSPMAAAVALEIEQRHDRRPSMEEIALILADWGEHYPAYEAATRFLHDVVFTPADAALTAYYDALTAHGMADKIPAEAQQMYALAAAVGYLIVYADLCVIIDRPAEIHLDDRGRYHATDGPALTFRDGWCRGFVRGIPIPRELAIPATRAAWLTPQRVLDCPNAEERRVMLEIYGADRFIEELGAKPIDASDFGTLYKVAFGNPDVEPDEDETADEPLVMVKLINSTEELDEHGKPHRKVYWLRVPPHIERAREAVAWTFGMTEQEYAPTQES